MDFRYSICTGFGMGPTSGSFVRGHDIVVPDNLEVALKLKSPLMSGNFSAVHRVRDIRVFFVGSFSDLRGVRKRFLNKYR